MLSLRDIGEEKKITVKTFTIFREFFVEFFQ